jgi:hypothetical protein
MFYNNNLSIISFNKSKDCISWSSNYLGIITSGDHVFIEFESLLDSLGELVALDE